MSRSRERDFKVLAAVDDDAHLTEVHIAHSKHGTFGHGVLEAFGELLSAALSYGMPLDEFVAQLVGTRFEPQGWTDDPEIQFVTSPLDYLARRLAPDFLSPERRMALGVLEPADVA